MEIRIIIIIIICLKTEMDEPSVNVHTERLPGKNLVHLYTVICLVGP